AAHWAYKLQELDRSRGLRGDDEPAEGGAGKMEGPGATTERGSEENGAVGADAKGTKPLVSDSERLTREHVRRWLGRLEDLEARSNDSVEFQKQVQIDAYPGEIFVFSPKGDIYQLPRGATPVDFAYAVHSHIGNTCVIANVNHRMHSLNEPLESGQTVEIIHNDQAEPSPMWLNSVKTSKARSAIRAYHRDLEYTRAIDFGERLLRRALKKYAMEFDGVPLESLESLAHGYQCDTPAELLASLGRGNYAPSQIAARLIEIERGQPIDDLTPVEDVAPVQIHAPDEKSLHLGACCRPVPGDPIKGYLTLGEGMIVHRAECPSGLRLQRKGRVEIDVAWADAVRGGFSSMVEVRMVDEPGSLVAVASVLSELRINIQDIRMEKLDEDNMLMRFELSVRGVAQLDVVIQRLQRLPTVWQAERVQAHRK
ncbi:MAG: hypothetical protein CSA54_05235, partial [Gammaproteobacteria bacterium]